MSGTRSGGGPDDGETVSWATESLPLALRKELLERELKELGFGKAAAQSGGSRNGGAAQKQQPLQDESSHPKAGKDEDDARQRD
jgi:hypothetical protein